MQGVRAHGAQRAHMLVDGLAQGKRAQEGWEEKRTAQQRELNYVWGERDLQKGLGNGRMATYKGLSKYIKENELGFSLSKRSYKYEKEEN